jgi:hypothetical protein
MEFFRDANYDFMGRRWVWLTISGVAMAASIVALFALGQLNIGIDFAGPRQGLNGPRHYSETLPREDFSRLRWFFSSSRRCRQQPARYSSFFLPFPSLGRVLQRQAPAERAPEAPRGRLRMIAPMGMLARGGNPPLPRE